MHTVAILNFYISVLSNYWETTVVFDGDYVLVELFSDYPRVWLKFRGSASEVLSLLKPYLTLYN